MSEDNREKVKKKSEVYPVIATILLILAVAFGYRMHGIISNVLEWQVHRIASAITAGPVDVEDKAKWEKLTDKEKKEKYLLLFREAETACYTTHIIVRLKPYEKYDQDGLVDLMFDMTSANKKERDKYYEKLMRVAAVINKHNSWEHLKDVSASREELKKILKEFRK